MYFNVLWYVLAFTDCKNTKRNVEKHIGNIAKLAKTQEKWGKIAENVLKNMFRAQKGD